MDKINSDLKDLYKKSFMPEDIYCILFIINHPGDTPISNESTIFAIDKLCKFFNGIEENKNITCTFAISDNNIIIVENKIDGIIIDNSNINKSLYIAMHFKKIHMEKYFYEKSKDIYEEIGYNLKPIELQAAMGLSQLKKLDEIGVLRRRNHKLLYNIFEVYSDYFILPKATEGSDPDWFAFALTIKDNSKFTRAEFCKFLEKNKIQTRPYFAGNILLQPGYQGIMDSDKVINDFPIARKVTTDTFFLGCSPVITEEQIKYIADIVDGFFLKNYSNEI